MAMDKIFGASPGPSGVSLGPMDPTGPPVSLPLADLSSTPTVPLGLQRLASSFVFAPSSAA